MAKCKNGKGGGGNAHDRAMARAKAESVLPQTLQFQVVEPKEAAPISRHNLADTLQILGLALAVILWVLLPSLVLRIVLGALGIVLLVHLAYRSHWSGGWSVKGRRIAAAAVIIVVGGTIAFQVFGDWRKALAKPPVSQPMHAVSQAGADNSCPPATGLCVHGNSETISGVEAVGSPNGIVVAGDNNRIENVSTISQIEEYSDSPQRTEYLMAELRKEHYKKWQKLPDADREARHHEAAELEREIRNSEGDPEKVGPLLTKLWVMK